MSTIQFLIGGKTWSMEAGTRRSLLDEALSYGLPISYSCKRGDCGQCVGKLLAGVADPVDAARPFIRETDIYLCNAVPRNDLVIELPHTSELDRVRILRSPCKINQLNRLSDDVVEVSFRLPATLQFEFLPGQYVRLTNKDRITRSYSLADAPRPDKLLHIHVRRVSDGVFSRYVFGAAKVGDLLHLEGPMGNFVLRDGVTVKKTVFLATGTGIAPIYALLASMSSVQRTRCGDLFLYWGNRRPDDAYFSASLADLAEQLELKYFEVFSRSHVSVSSQSASYVQRLMATHHSDLSDAQVFASGNPAMIDDGRKQALLLGLPSSKYFADPFTAS